MNRHKVTAPTYSVPGSMETYRSRKRDNKLCCISENLIRIANNEMYTRYTVHAILCNIAVHDRLNNSPYTKFPEGM